MLKKQNKYKMVAFLAFALYFLTGAACIVVGSSLSHLVKMYGIALDKVVLLGSAYALGRVLTVYFTGRMVEKFGVDGSPSCGVDYTCCADWYGSFECREGLDKTFNECTLEKKSGIFMQVLKEMLKENGLSDKVKVTSLFAPEPEKCLEILDK